MPTFGLCFHHTTNVMPLALHVNRNNFVVQHISLLTSTANGSTLISIMNVLPTEKKIRVLAALVEGNSIRSTERMLGTHRDTIMRLLVRVGENCQRLMAERMRGFHCRLVQADEIWTFCGKKEHRLTAREKLNPGLGDQYTFIALDSESKLIPTYEIGKRDGLTALRFMEKLQNCLAGNGKIQLTTDGFRAYLEAVERTFGADIDFAQLVKVYSDVNPGRGRYAPPRVSEVISTRITGTPNVRFISTSHVESHNLNLRMRLRRFTRLTNGYSKKLSNLKAALSLYFAHYNFVRIHSTLRMTPGMAAGVTDCLWDLGDLLPKNSN